jgi:O-antigen/teichoic acid export membrane protein
MLKNVLSNYIARFWGIISVYIFIPFYIKLLGIEAYAVINFYSVILTIMYFADAGLSATLNREMARTDNKFYLGTMLFTIERLYFFICLFIVFFISLFSGLIANNWLNSQTILSNDLKIYIVLMGISVAFQLFTTLESSGLMGLEKQVLANGIQVSSSIFRSAIVLIPLYFFPTLLTFFVWHCFVNGVFLFITRFNLWKYIKTDVTYNFDRNILKTVGKFAGGMVLMAIISSLNTQIDKLVTSKLLSLKDFGYYSLAGVLSQVPVLMITPISAAILPKMVKFSEKKDTENLSKLFHISSFVLSSFATSAALVILLFTKDFILIWTHDEGIAITIENVTKILIIGSVFLSFQFMPYNLAIANGHTKTNVQLGAVSLTLIIPALYFLVKANGIIGAAYTWLIFNVVACFYLGYILIGKFLMHEFKKWLFYDTILPLLTNISVGLIVYYIINNLPKGLYVLIYSAIIVIVSLLLNLFLLSKIYPKYNLVDFIGLKKLNS